MHTFTMGWRSGTSRSAGGTQLAASVVARAEDAEEARVIRHLRVVEGLAAASSEADLAIAPGAKVGRYRLLAELALARGGCPDALKILEATSRREVSLRHRELAPVFLLTAEAKIQCGDPEGALKAQLLARKLSTGGPDTVHAGFARHELVVAQALRMSGRASDAWAHARDARELLAAKIGANNPLLEPYDRELELIESNLQR